METIYQIFRVGRVDYDTGVRCEVVKKTKDMLDLAFEMTKNDNTESLLVMSIDSRHRVTTVFRTHTEVKPKEVFKSAIWSAAESIRVCRVLPPGDETFQPSKEDLSLLKKLKGAGALLECELLDYHIISGRKSFSVPI